MRKILFIGILMGISIYSYSQDQQIEHKIELIINGLENSDPDDYLAMYNEDVFMTALLGDTSSVGNDILIMIDKNPEIVTTVLRESFNRLESNMKRKLQTDTLNIELLNYEVDYKDITNEITHMTLIVYVEVNSKVGNFMMYIGLAPYKSDNFDLGFKYNHFYS